MKKMKKVFITTSLTIFIFISSSICVFATPNDGGGITPNSYKSPISVNILLEKVESK